MVDFVTVASVSIPMGLALSISAMVASFADWDRRFKNHPDFKNEYRVPISMMFLSGLGVIPILGVMYGVASWVMFFRRADLVK